MLPRVDEGLARSRDVLLSDIKSIFNGVEYSGLENKLEKLEEILLSADLGKVIKEE